MPKQALHINRFEGGMNTDFAPEDIPDNSLLDALGISVSSIGRIVMPGDTKATTSVDDQNAAYESGYGLFSFNSDYKFDDSEAATKYLVVPQGSRVQIWDGEAWNDNSNVYFDMGASASGHTTQNSYYAPNGDLRVCDGKFTHTNNYDNNVKWFGYTPNKTIGIGDGDASVGGWHVQDTSIESGYPKDSSGYATNAVVVDFISVANSNAFGLLNYSGNDGDGNSTHLYKNNEWGCRFEYQPASDSASTYSGSTWQTSVNTEYKFYSSYVYDGNQEGNPTPMTMYPTLINYKDGADDVSKQSAIRFIDRSNAANFNYCTVARSGTTVTVNTFDNEARDSAETHNIEVGDTILIEGSDDLKGYYTVTVDNDEDTFTYEHGTSGTVSAENAYYSKVGTNLAVFFAPLFKFNNDNSQTYNFGGATVGATSGGNQRIKGSRIYYSSSDEGHANLWLIIDANWEKGVKAFGVGKDEPTVTDYIPWKDSGVANNERSLTISLGDFNVWKHPPRYETYESLNGYSHDSKLDAKWKTAIIANGRAYIANVKRREKSTFDINDTALTSGKQDWGRRIHLGTADGNTTNKLIDSSEDFSLGHIRVGDIIENATDSTTGRVKAIDSATTISVMDDAGDNLDLCPDGNETYTIHSTSTEPTFGDRILKSPVDRFDTFPEEMAIELFGGDDGDQVVKLETFADRIFVFKKNILHILNIAKDVEILESSHKGMGLDGGLPCQSCVTRNGIAWINSSGAYHYNGENIESLTDNKIDSFWKGKISSHVDQDTLQNPFWFSRNIPSIGFDIASNKLIIHKVSIISFTDNTCDYDDDTTVTHDANSLIVAGLSVSGTGISAGAYITSITDSTHFELSASTTGGAVTNGTLTFGNDEDILIYDMKIKAWTWINEGTDTDTRTNMVNYNGELVFHELSGATSSYTLKYDDSPHSPGVTAGLAGVNLSVYTKPFDFGTPLQRKKIYKVYVTYRCSGTTNVQIKYYVNGDTSTTYHFATGATNPFGADDGIADDTSMEFDNTAGKWETAALKLATSSEANNIKSFGLFFFNDASNAVDADFEINDITIIYRTKSVK